LNFDDSGAEWKPHEVRDGGKNIRICYDTDLFSAINTGEVEHVNSDI
jgi:hypothetical protein